MKLTYVRDVIIPAAYELLPAKMESREATSMLLVIGLQESRFQYRRQIMGPARGYWMFEARGGVWGVMNHRASEEHAHHVLTQLDYPHTIDTVHEALADNDILAACFTRLLLWTDPAQLPALDVDPEFSWQYYERNWRPGKPHRTTWDQFWQRAIEVTA